MNLRIIAHARNGFSQKFGIPRQSRADSCIETRIVFDPTFAVREALRGIEDYSHLWLIWGFSEVKQGDDWSPTVRPPRLGGNKRMGVFATRSPFRPNPIGLTSVRLLRVEESASDGLVLVVSGADLLDGTPIYDIKPYLTFSDSHPDAKSGFAEQTQDYRLQVHVPQDVMEATLKSACPWEDLHEILSQDPRPAYQHDATRVYYVEYMGWEVAFTVDELQLYVQKIYQK